jgi:hypothetical protein
MWPACSLIERPLNLNPFIPGAMGKLLSSFGMGTRSIDQTLKPHRSDRHISENNATGEADKYPSPEIFQRRLQSVATFGHR